MPCRILQMKNFFSHISLKRIFSLFTLATITLLLVVIFIILICTFGIIKITMSLHLLQLKYLISMVVSILLNWQEGYILTVFPFTRKKNYLT